MKNVVNRYNLRIKHKQKIKLPVNTRVLSAREINGSIYLWVIEDKDEKKKEKRIFRLYGTDDELQVDLDHLIFINTICLIGGDIGWQLFEEIK